jgi:hypothetical protein
MGFPDDACPLRRSEGDVFYRNSGFRGIGSSESTRFPEGLVLGNSGKPVTLETSSLTKFLDVFFRGKAFAIFRNLESAKPRKREHAIFGNLESAKTRNREHATFGNLELVRPRSRKHAEVWISSWRGHELQETGNSRICWKSGSEVKSGEIHEPVRSKGKVVVPKSPGLRCELTAGL